MGLADGFAVVPTSTLPFCLLTYAGVFGNDASLRGRAVGRFPLCFSEVQTGRGRVRGSQERGKVGGDDSKKNAPGKREGAALAAGYPSGSGGTRKTGIPVSRGGRQSEASAHFAHYLHPGSREGAGTDQRMTAGPAHL